MSVGNAEQTSLTSYRLVYTNTGAGDTEPATFPLGIVDGDIDLHEASWGGKGTETKANRLCFLFLADAGGTSTIVMTGACDGGCEEYIASLDLTAVATVETGTNIWVEDIDLTSYHIAEDAILIADSGNSRPAKFAYDAVGYRYISFYVTAMANMKQLKVYARHF